MRRPFGPSFAAAVVLCLTAGAAFGQTRRGDDAVTTEKRPRSAVASLGDPEPPEEDDHAESPPPKSKVKKAQFQAPGAVELPDDLPTGGRPENGAPALSDRYGAAGGIERPFRIEYTYLGPAPLHNDAGGNIHMNEVGLRYQFRLPVGDIMTLRITPIFDVLFLAGPSQGDPDLPPQVYKLATDVETSFAIGERYSLILGITPGIWSDLHTISGDDFRFPARALVAYKVNDGFYVAGGLNYTANYYHALLPTVGVIWDWTDRVRAEVVWPRARLIYRLHEDIQFYTGFEGGGDTWEIHQDGQSGKFQYRDLRFLFGSELSTFRRYSFMFESGVAFNRRLRVDFQDDRNIGPAYFFRMGVRF